MRIYLLDLDTRLSIVRKADKAFLKDASALSFDDALFFDKYAALTSVKNKAYDKAFTLV